LFPSKLVSTDGKITGVNRSDKPDQTLLTQTNSTRTLIDVKDAARALGLSCSTLYEWARFRRVPHVRLGDRLLFDPHDLEAFVQQRKVGVG